MLTTALRGGASFLVTGDVRFRNRVRQYQGIRLLSPADFLRVLQDEEGRSPR